MLFQLSNNLQPCSDHFTTQSALWWQLKASAKHLRPPRHVRQIAAKAGAAAAAADAPFKLMLQQLQQSPNELLLFLRSLLRQLLVALEAVHRRHVTHRDVKLVGSWKETEGRQGNTNGVRGYPHCSCVLASLCPCGFHRKMCYCSLLFRRRFD